VSVGNILPGVFTPVLAKHSKAFSRNDVPPAVVIFTEQVPHTPV